MVDLGRLTRSKGRSGARSNRSGHEKPGFEVLVVNVRFSDGGTMVVSWRRRDREAVLVQLLHPSFDLERKKVDRTVMVTLIPNVNAVQMATVVILEPKPGSKSTEEGNHEAEPQ